MALGQMLYILMLVFGFFQTSHSYIFIGDDSQGGAILWAPLPSSQDNTNIMDTRFNVIPLSIPFAPSDIAWDPAEMWVYYNGIVTDVINRVKLDGSMDETVFNTLTPRTIALDLVNRNIYWTSLTDLAIYRGSLERSNSTELLYTNSPEEQSTILVSGEFLLWSSQHPNMLTMADLDTNDRTNVVSYFPDTMTIEKCADDSIRLYYTRKNMLGVISLDGSVNDSLTIFEESSALANTINKYGGKLFGISTFSWTYPIALLEYDIPTATLTRMNSTVMLVDGSYHTMVPTSIRIVNSVYDYDRPVAIQDCPDDITITLEEGSNSTTVSWAEPRLNMWSSCPRMEFDGEISNGANVSMGEFDLSYMASDTAGNIDTCQFTVTVLGKLETTPSSELETTPSSELETTPSSKLETTPSSNPATTACDGDQSGSGTTFFSFVNILRTLVPAFLFVITLK